MITKQCECCGKEFKAKPADVARGWGKFCSKSCAATAKGKQSEEYCLWNDSSQPEGTPADYAELQAQMDQLQTELFNYRKKCKLLDKILTESTSRRGDIEQRLFDIANGKAPIPTMQDCRIMALRLGTPKKQWPDVVLNYKYEGDLSDQLKEGDE